MKSITSISFKNNIIFYNKKKTLAKKAIKVYKINLNHIDNFICYCDIKIIP